jgi:hypothetical protein
MESRSFIAAIGVAITLLAGASSAADCAGIDPLASRSMRANSRPSPGSCHVGISDGVPIPDPSCTPGAINPTVTLDVLRRPDFRTACVRDQATSHKEKMIVYEWYGLPHPAQNWGDNQSCEMDHVIPLELGGADTLDNIWPQCGPAGGQEDARYFRLKDIVENFLTWSVKSDLLDLAAAQRGIATDWKRYLTLAQATCPAGRCPDRR